MSVFAQARSRAPNPLDAPPQEAEPVSYSVASLHRRFFRTSSRFLVRFWQIILNCSLQRVHANTKHRRNAPHAKSFGLHLTSGLHVYLEQHHGRSLASTAGTL